MHLVLPAKKTASAHELPLTAPLHSQGSSVVALVQPAPVKFTQDLQLASPAKKTAAVQGPPLTAPLHYHKSNAAALT